MNWIELNHTHNAHFFLHYYIQNTERVISLKSECTHTGEFLNLSELKKQWCFIIGFSIQWEVNERIRRNEWTNSPFKLWSRLQTSHWFNLLFVKHISLAMYAAQIWSFLWLKTTIEDQTDSSLIYLHATPTPSWIKKLWKHLLAWIESSECFFLEKVCSCSQGFEDFQKLFRLPLSAWTLLQG